MLELVTKRQAVPVVLSWYTSTDDKADREEQSRAQRREKL